MAPCSLSKISHLHALGCAIPDGWHSFPLPRVDMSKFYHSFITCSFIYLQQYFTTGLLCARLRTRHFYMSYFAPSSRQPCKEGSGFTFTQEETGLREVESLA